MRISQNLELFFLFFFLRIHFQFFSRSFCFHFSLPFFSLYLLPFIPFLSTGKVLTSALLKTWKSNFDQLGDLAYFTTIFAPKIGLVFSGIALPKFGRYGWICLCCVTCLSKQSGDVKNDDVTSGSMSPGRKRPKNKTLGGKEKMFARKTSTTQIFFILL